MNSVGTRTKNALARIYKREKAIDGLRKGAGIHWSCREYVATDGRMAVLFEDMPDAGIPEGAVNNDLAMIIHESVETGTHVKLDWEPDMTAMRRHCQAWQTFGMFIENVPFCTLECTDRFGREISCEFNEQYIVDACDCVSAGSAASFWLGHSASIRIDTLLVFGARKVSQLPCALILPRGAGLVS